MICLACLLYWLLFRFCWTVKTVGLLNCGDGSVPFDFARCGKSVSKQYCTSTFGTVGRNVRAFGTLPRATNVAELKKNTKDEAFILPSLDMVPQQKQYNNNNNHHTTSHFS